MCSRVFSCASAAFTTGKNSSDISMVIDAMDLLHCAKEPIHGFALVSSDSDFTGLAQRLREAGKHVLGFGDAHTPDSFVQACHHFITNPPVQRATHPARKGHRESAKKAKRRQADSKRNKLNDTKPDSNHQSPRRRKRRGTKRKNVDKQTPEKKRKRRNTRVVLG
jgi:hypothetical protein